MKSVIQELTSLNQEIHCLQYGINPVKAEVKQKLVYSNRLHKPLYRIDLIIRLFADFYQNHQDWKLIIGAEGESTNELKLLAEQLLPPSAYEFVGWLNAELNAHWYAKSSIYVSLPESDGTSVSLLEAMSADCVPVVPDLAVSHEWIESGKNGIVYDESSNPFADALAIDASVCHQINQRIIAERALRSTTSKMFYSIYKSVVK
jgi:glycosyltransferase involved in cell wall biosynthesis